MSPQRIGSSNVTEPDKGWTAYFLELTYDVGAPTALKLTTNVKVIPDTVPFAGKPLHLPTSLTRDFPYGLSLEPIQTRNLRDYSNTSSPSLMRVDFSTSFPSSSPSDPGTGPIGAFSSGQRVFCADHLHEEHRFPLFDPLQLHVT